MDQVAINVDQRRLARLFSYDMRIPYLVIQGSRLRGMIHDTTSLLLSVFCYCIANADFHSTPGSLQDVLHERRKISNFSSLMQNILRKRRVPDDLEIFPSISKPSGGDS